MTAFETAYQQLNPEQKQAVDQTDGPVLVIAGPGTGKTQLLAVRVANILNTTDTLAGSVLCLTFTESAQATMQQRLVSFIKEAAYGVAIQTFHSFAGDVISRYSEYFEQSPTHSVADALVSFDILQELFEELPFGHPLVARDGDSYVHLASAKSRISHLKQAGLEPNQLRDIIQRDLADVRAADPLVDQLEAGVKPSVRAKHLPAYQAFADELAKRFSSQELQHGFEPLLHVAGEELHCALEKCYKLGNKTAPLTVWRRKWLTTTKEGAHFKDATRLVKLEAVADIYERYQARLKKSGLRDFDDLLLQVISTMKRNPDLLASLQEQYQYILVDEYQDTNGVQQELLELLADNPVNELRPNLMVVGDDDQAIYGFQGANPYYMRRFEERWRDVTRVKLTRNYRSTPEIIDFAQSVIGLAEYRDTTTDAYLIKTIQATRPPGDKPEVLEYDHPLDMYWGLTQAIASQLSAGVAAKDIAVIAPRHRRLSKLAPYLLRANIPINYERRDNVLQESHISQLLLVAKTIQAIADNNLSLADSLLPELLSLPFWKLATATLWQLQLTVHQSPTTSWLEHLRLADGRLGEIANWLLSASRAAQTQPLDYMLDVLLGNQSLEGQTSPFGEYYFSADRLNREPAAYVTMLSGLNTLRRRLENWRTAGEAKLGDLLLFTELATHAGEYIVDNHPIVLSKDSVNLLTAHRAKGQEFAVVYLLEADQANWVSDRGRPSTIGLPANLPIEPQSDEADEKLRRFYVASTRAADRIVLVRSLHDDVGKPQLPLMWLTPEAVQNRLTTSAPSAVTPLVELSDGQTSDWRVLQLSQLEKQADLRDVLADRLATYHLSASHLNTWLDLRFGGPTAWLTDNLLGFPHQVGPDAAYGTAIHFALEHQHHLVVSGQSLASSVAIADFDRALATQPLDDATRQKLTDRGHQALPLFLQAQSENFRPFQQAEYNVAKARVVLDGARLYGKLDVIDIDPEQKTITITDYKTGRSFADWQPVDSTHRQKLHGYKRQLIFYKLLLENTAEFHGYTADRGRLSFVEPDDDGCINVLETSFSEAEVAEVKQLIAVIWQDMMSLHIPHVSGHTAAASRQFEKQLLEKNQLSML